MSKKQFSRRDFVQKTALTAGMAPIASFSFPGTPLPQPGHGDRPPRQVWIAGVSQAGLRTKTPEDMVARVLGILADVKIHKPDFVCLPEVFPFEYVDKETTLKEKIEISEKVLEQFSEFSRQNECYTICPVYTSSGGRVYNSAVVFGRNGNYIGQYNKIHETTGMIKYGISCGALFQPAIKTEFGPVGIQICYDINWDDGWKMLNEQGVRIIFWCSAFDGGMQLNMKALRYKCIVASSTNKNNAKVCDISGETLATTGIWNPNFYCGQVNLEKIFLPTYDYLKEVREIELKYGRKVRIKVFHEEEWTIIESLSPDIYIADIAREFNLKSHDEGLREAEIIQDRSRG